MVVVAAAVPALVDWWRDRHRTGLDPLRYVALHLADDVAYGTGVWAGCGRERTIAPLVPDLRSWPGRRVWVRLAVPWRRERTQNASRNPGQA